MNTINIPVSPTTTFPDRALLTPQAVGILTAAAYWLMNYKQNRVTTYNEEKKLEVVISTDFSKEKIEGTDKEGVVLNAEIAEGDQKLKTRFVIHHIPQLPKAFATGWQEAAWENTFLRVNAEKLAA